MPGAAHCLVSAPPRLLHRPRLRLRLRSHPLLQVCLHKEQARSVMPHTGAVWGKHRQAVVIDISCEPISQ